MRVKKNSLKNLRPFNKLSKKELREIQSKGGKARAEKIRTEKALRESLKEKLYTDNCRELEKLTKAIIERGIKGDVRAFEVIRDTIGEKPKDSLDINSNDITIKISE